YGLFAFAIAGREHRASVGGGLFLPGREAAIALPRHGGSFGIDLIEIIENGGDGAAHVVDVETVEAGAPLRRNLIVVRPQPIDESLHIGVAPDPGGKSLDWCLGAGSDWRRALVADECDRIGRIR